MSVVMLSEAERERFARWLEQELQQNKALVEQLEKLPGPLDVSGPLKTEMTAAIVYIAKLRSIESVTIE